jgi:hypothetical protein
LGAQLLESLDFILNVVLLLLQKLAAGVVEELKQE